MFEAFSFTSLSINVPIVDDLLVENQEVIDIMATIDNNTGGGFLGFISGGSSANAEIIIIDNDGKMQTAG